MPKNKAQNTNVTSESIIFTEQNAILSDAEVVLSDSDSELLDYELPDFELNAGAIGRGFIPVIRMGHIQKDESVSYASYQPGVGTVCPITPVGDKSKVKKPVFTEATFLSPRSGAPLALSKIEAATPQGKNKLTPDLIIGSMFTPQGKNRTPSYSLSRQRG